MDVHDSHSLVFQPQPSEQGALVPIAWPLVVDDGSVGEEDERRARFWRAVLSLCGLLLLALLVVRRLQRLLLELRQQAGYWQALHQRAVGREAVANEEIQLLKGQIRELERRLYGRKSETSARTQPQAKFSSQHNTPPRPRGQQPGAKGHGRRSHEHLPTEHEDCVLADDDHCCPHCHEPYVAIPGTADGDILEIEVHAYRRRYHRKRYRCQCVCPGQPALLTAPPPDKLIPKSNLGISVWVLLLLHKFQFFQPLHRVLAELRGHDLHLAAGSITGGLQKLVPLLQPLYELLVEHNRDAGHWHCDETRWLVFAKQTAKAGFAWNLWVFAAAESIVFVLDPTRSHDVPEGHFGDDAEGIANVDRYSAYKAMAQVKAGRIVLAFCWAHVRRDFLAVLTSWTELTDWSWSWLEEIGLLYHGNEQRLLVQDDATKYAEAEQRLQAQVEHMGTRCDTELLQPDLRPPQRKTLKSLKEHWSGLTVFVTHPEVPMDNNTAERCHRGPVVARKNFYGSGALWSGRLAAMLFSLFQTMQLWKMDVGKWLSAYLTACAKAGGQPPPEPQRFLPWNLTPPERERFSPATPPAPKPPGATAPASA
jgi:transposase